MWDEINVWWSDIWDSRRGCIVVFVLLLVVAIMAGSRALRFHANRSTVPSVNSEKNNASTREQTDLALAAEGGDWERVAHLVDELRLREQVGVGASTLGKSSLNALKVESQIHFLRAPRNTGARQGNLMLARGDEYWLELQPSRECYLYVVRQTVGGATEMLFPSATYSSIGNPSGATIRVPDDYKTLVANADRPCEITLYVLGARWRQAKLENLLATPGPEAASQIQHMFARAERYSPGIGGLTFGKYKFHYEPGGR